MSLLAGVGLKILMGLAIAGAVAAAFFGIRNSGKAIERAEQKQRNSEVRRRQDAVKAPDSGDVDGILSRL